MMNYNVSFEIINKGRYLDYCNININNKINEHEFLFPKSSMIQESKLHNFNKDNLFAKVQELNIFNNIEQDEELKSLHGKLLNNQLSDKYLLKMINDSSIALKFLFNLKIKDNYLKQYIDYCKGNKLCYNNYYLLFLKNLFIENSSNDLFLYFKKFILNPRFNKILKLKKQHIKLESLKYLLNINNKELDKKYYEEIFIKFIDYYYDIKNHNDYVANLNNKIYIKEINKKTDKLIEEKNSLNNNFKNYLEQYWDILDLKIN